MANGKLPFGTSDFEALRLDGQIYVDKTDLIFDLASERSKIFLSRPRRFGKSLLVSTFETLFRDGLKYFDGLKIADRWKDTTYGVVKLDLSLIKDKRSIGEMSRAFDGILRMAFENVGFAYASADGMTCLEQITAWLRKCAPSSLVLLVDEYDAPLNSHLDDAVFFNQIRDMLSGFFSLVKSTDRVWRFIFITGIAKFNKASIFSAFNNLKDISLNPRYGTLLGYTESEILENFQSFVARAAQINDMDTRSLMASMREQYDGFCFDEDAATHVYAPWSVLSFLDEPGQGLRNFWYGSSGQASVVKNYLRLHPLANTVATFGDDIPVSMEKLRDSNDAETLSPPVFLFQAGYLSIRRASPDMAYLNFPNGEVRHSMNRLMAEQLLQTRDLSNAGLDSWRDAAQKGDVGALITAMNGTFNQIDYLGYPLTQESHVRAAVQIYLMALRQGVIVEKHYSHGQSDLEFDAGSFHWVMEFKYARDDDNPDVLLSEALSQITEKRYGEGMDIGNMKLLRIGLVFDGAKRQFVRHGVA